MTDGGVVYVRDSRTGLLTAYTVDVSDLDVEIERRAIVVEAADA